VWVRIGLLSVYFISICHCPHCPLHQYASLHIARILVRMLVYPCVCQYVCLLACLYISLSVYLSICVSVYKSVCQYINLCLYVCLIISVCLSVYLSVCLYVCLSAMRTLTETHASIYNGMDIIEASLIRTHRSARSYSTRQGQTKGRG